MYKDLLNLDETHRSFLFMRYPHTFPSITQPLVACPGAGSLLCKIASTKNSKTNVTRNLRRVIKDADALVPIEVELVSTTIRLRKPRSRIVPIYWPVFSMRSWCEILMTKYPKVMLGGIEWELESEWRNLLTWFWQAFYHDDPLHPIFQSGDWDPSCTIPYMTHGDEGRGQRSQPFMVQSWQTVLSVFGPGESNMSGNLIYIFIYTFSFLPSPPEIFQRIICLYRSDHVICQGLGLNLRHSFCSRFLHSCISSKLYNGEKTLRDINQAWAAQMASLYHDGFEVGYVIV